MSDTNGALPTGRMEFLERTLWGIRDAIAKAAEIDDLPKTLRVIAQKVDWALDGSPRAEILGALDNAPLEEVAPIVGFRMDLTVDRPCTIRLQLTPGVDDVGDRSGEAPASP